MIKKLRFVISLLLVAAVFAIGAFAATTTAYVKKDATGTGLSSSSPIGSISDAFGLLGADGGTIYIIGEYPITSGTTIGEKKFDYTLKAGTGGCISLSANLALAKNTNDNTVTFDLPFKIVGSDARILFGGFNNVVFGKNFSVSALDGGCLNFYGGMRSGTVEAITELPYSITVNAGTFNVFAGGNFRDSISAYVGSVAAPVSITINGGTFGKSGTYQTSSNNKDYDTFSVSGMSILADKATLTIKGGTFYHPIYIQGRLGTVAGGASAKSNKVRKNKKYYVIDGDITVNISGGTFKGGAVSAYYTQAGYTTVMRGNYTVKVTGGTFASGTVFDATQVKGYEGSTKKATITYPTSKSITPKRFDVVNGTSKTYTDPIRVVFIGDSITEGYAVTDAGVDRMTESYPAKFLKYAESAGKEVIISNFGVAASGLHPATKRFYHNMLAWPMASEAAPDYVFVAIGINDALTIGGTNGAFTTFKTNYTNLLKTMGNLPDTDKVFVTNAIYCNISDATQMQRAAAALRPTQQILAEDLAETDSKKYVFVDFYGLTLSKGLDDSLFKADNGTVYERLHPATAGLDFMGKTLYNAAFGGVTKPSTARKTTVYVSDSGSSRGAGTSSAPISDLSYAYSLLDPNKACTIYISGTLSVGGNLHTPVSTQTVTFAGAGSGAVLNIHGNTLKVGSNIKFTNLTLKASGNVLNIHGCYKNVEITSTVKTSGVCSFYAGFPVFSDVSSSSNTIHDSVSSASSSRNCTVKINGGTYRNFALGNGRYAADAPIGSYSGTMNATIGSGVVIGDSSSICVGIVGRNYIKGTINVTVNGWGSGDILEYAAMGSVSSSVGFDKANNTGCVYIKAADSLKSKIKYQEVTPSISYDGEAVTLSWLKKGAATRYRIFRRKAGETAWDGVSRYTTATSYKDTTMAANIKYEYAVQAWIPIDDGYDYSESYLVSITTKLLPTPSLTAKNTTTGIKITISAVTGAEGYKIYRSTDNKTFTQIAKVTATSYEDTTATTNKTYYYRVRAYTNADGTRYSANSESFATIRLAAVNPTVYYSGIDGGVRLSWSAVTNATRYRIFRRVAGESSWDSVTRYATATEYIDTTAELGVTYDYAVQSWVPLGDKFIYSSGVTVTLTPTEVSVPTIKVSNSIDGVKITASGVTGAEGYIFYRSIDGKTLTQIKKSTSATYVDTAAKADTAYYYYASAYIGASRSNTSEAVQTIRLAPVESTVFYSGIEGGVHLSWSAVKNAARYRIFRRVSGESAWDGASRYSLTTEYVDTTAEIGVTYEYAVQSWVLLNDKYVYSSGTTETITPATVAIPTVTVKNTVDGLSMTASGVADADGYIFYRSTDGKTLTKLSKTTSATYVDKTAKADTAYYYYACAYIGSNCSGYSDAVQIIRLVPVEFNAYYSESENSVHLEWNAVKNADKYRIFRRVSGESAWDGVNRFSETTEYIDKTVTLGVTYEYSVQSWVILGDKYVYGSMTTDIITPTVHGVPSLSAKKTSSGVVLTSTAVTDADGYVFYRSTDGTSFTELASTTVNTYTDTTIANKAVYYYKVCAYFADADAAGYSDFSEIATVYNYSYAEVHEGTSYDKVAARVDDINFAFYEMQYECGKNASLNEIPDGAYVYCVYGDFILEVDESSIGSTEITLPYENADAIIFASAPIITYGDADADGEITLLDVIKVLKYTVDAPTEIDIAAANISGDIQISTLDLIMILQKKLS
ncbi:MAG: hypothetical protein IJA60_01905 [Clostridia bacterium]|nr:hypothetical protein [Clostridia bacterium]